MVGLEEAFDVGLTTGSGYPPAQPLHQAVKDMSASGRIVKEDGPIFCTAECSDGLPKGGEYELSEEGLTAAGLEETEDIGKTVREAPEAAGAAAGLCVLPEGPQTVRYL